MQGIPPPPPGNRCIQVYMYSIVSYSACACILPAPQKAVLVLLFES